MFDVRLALAALAILAVGFVPAAAAKDFQPGDLRICGPKKCAPIVNPALMKPIGTFYYGPTSPDTAPAPRLGARTYELRFAGNGYATGIVAGAKLDRFLSYGVNLGHFQRDRWYRLPTAVSADLRKLAVSLKPYRLTRAALAKSR